MYQKILIFFLGFFFLGCQQQIPEEQAPMPDIAPHHILLQDKSGNFNGIALAFEKSTFLSVRPETEDPSELFWGGQKIPILKKYLEKNIVFFSLEKKIPLFESIEKSPLLGAPVYWFSNAQLQKGEISGISDTEIFIKGDITPYIQGSPFFTKDGHLLGVLSEASPKESLLIGLKIEPVLNFWETNK